MRRITINDVAEAAGVSRQTVSRAINGKDEISARTRERVMAAVEKLGYRPSRLAQGMVTQRTRTVGLEVADITNPIFAEIVRGAQDVAMANEYHLFLANSGDDPEIARESLSALVTQGVDGIIAFAGNVPDEQVLAFADSFRPLILINRLLDHPNLSAVTIDVQRGATLAVQFLLARGHTAIGMLGNIVITVDNRRRVRGYQEAMAAAGRPAPADYLVTGRPTLRGGYEAMARLLTTRPEVTAIFAYNDLMAIGAHRACHDLGRRVPDDCAIIGFDDIPLAAMVTPALTTISYDHYHLGQEAMRQVLRMLAAPDQPIAPVPLPVTLIERETTR